MLNLEHFLCHCSVIVSIRFVHFPQSNSFDRLLGFSPCSNVRDCIGKYLMFLLSRLIKYMTLSYIFYFELEALDIVVEMYEASCPTLITCYSLL
jgi:hypothetical protein